MGSSSSSPPKILRGLRPSTHSLSQLEAERGPRTCDCKIVPLFCCSSAHVFVDLKIVHAGALQGRIKIRKQFFHEDSHGHLHRLTIPIAWRFASPDHSHRLTIRIA